jgi:hypothetical protein
MKLVDIGLDLRIGLRRAQHELDRLAVGAALAERGRVRREQPDAGNLRQPLVDLGDEILLLALALFPGLEPGEGRWRASRQGNRR